MARKKTEAAVAADAPDRAGELEDAAYALFKNIMSTFMGRLVPALERIEQNAAQLGVDIVYCYQAVEELRIGTRADLATYWHLNGKAIAEHALRRVLQVGPACGVYVRDIEGIYGAGLSPEQASDLLRDTQRDISNMLKSSPYFRDRWDALETRWLKDMQAKDDELAGESPREPAAGK